MTKTIQDGQNKDFWCKIGLHKWSRWRVISYFSSNVEDLEKRCLKCKMVKRKTIGKKSVD
jgi:hypothetical protein